ncbi:hypothetical protein K8I61_08680 [bacterium]|nr:hypothetical protein [bacterium]
MNATETAARRAPENIGDHGFWLYRELSRIHEDNRAQIERLARLEESVHAIAVQVAVKLDKDDFFDRLDELRHDETRRDSTRNEVLKILAAALAAAISALTGIKLLG